MSISDALQLMLGFGTFVVALIALVVELIKNQQKNILSLVVNHD
ncbi:putative holin-like toxin, partial [Lacticaseibacillus paracasei]